MNRFFSIFFKISANSKDSSNEHSSSANKAFYLLFAVSVLSLFLLINLIAKTIPLTVSHILYSCKEVITGISISLPHSLPSIFVLMLFFVVLIGLSLLSFQILKTRSFVSKILQNKISTPKRIRDIASKLGIDKQVDIVDETTYSSFCYGLIFPRICISLRLANSLTNGELKAVLVHENYHLKNKDPLRILLSQVIVSMFFFVPVLKDIHKYFILSKEFAADQLVVRTKLTNDLKSALTKSLYGLTPRLSTTATFANDSGLEQRISILTVPNFRIGINISVVRILISVTIFILALGILNLPVRAMENGNGTHSYFILPQGDISCMQENAIKKPIYDPMDLFSAKDYSPQR